MNQRSTEMIQLLSKERDEITLSGFAEYFQVSQKTIRNDLKEINGVLRQNKLEEVVINSGGKIILPKDFNNSVSVLIEGDIYSYKLSKEERKQIAAAMIVNSVDYITLATIAENLFVSRATLINDLKDIKAFIQEANLHVESHANKGLHIEGAESVRRDFLLNLMRPSIYEKHKNAVAKHLSIQAGDQNTIERILAEQEQRYKKYLNDNSFREIVLFLRIMVNRNQNGEFLEPQMDISSESYMFALDTLKYISQYCDVVTTEDDVKYFCKFLDGVRYIRNSRFSKNTVIIQMLTRQYIASISTELGINLNSDYDFFENLSHHLESVLSAPLIDYQESDVINEILEKNQKVLEAVNNQMPLIYQYTERKLSDMEIKYIAIHVCAAIERKKNKEIVFRVIVACHAGIGTSRLLLEKLKRHFKFRIVDVISAHEVVRIEPNSADFVISTVPLEGCSLEYVVVSAAFNDADYIRVGNRIDALRNSRNLPSGMEEEGLSARGLIEKIEPFVYDTFEREEKADTFMKELGNIIRDYFKQSVESEAEIISPSLHHLLTWENIEVDVQCEDWKDAVRRSAVKLLERGYIEERYIDAMIQSIEKYGPYVVLSPGFAMPHAKAEEGSIRLGMYFIRLKNPVSFGEEEGEPIDIEYVCCLSAIDQKSYLKAFFNLVNMINDDDYKQMIHDAKTPKEIARIIERYEHSI